MKLRTYIVPKCFKKPLPWDTGLWWPNYQVDEIDYIEIDFQFCRSAFYDWGEDMDARDWFKVGGLTGDWKHRNKDAVMIAARSTGKLMEVTAYTNQDAKWRIGYGGDQHILLMKPDEVGRARIINLGNNKWEYQFFKGTDFPINNKIVHECNLGKRAYKTGIYIGGSNNSPGRYGGRASQTMRIKKRVKIIKN